MRYGYGKEFWKSQREYKTKLEAERSSDFKVETYKNYEFQTWTNEKDRLILRVYKGNSGKTISYHYYGSEISRRETINNFKALADKEEKRKVERRENRKNVINPFKVGDILVSSWGYDQTNIDFYEVVEVTDKSVRIEEVSSTVLSDNGPGGMKVVPNKNHKTGKVMLKRVSSYNNNPDNAFVSISSYAYAYKWSGHPEYATNPVFGH